MEMIFVHQQVTKAVNSGENLITRGQQGNAGTATERLFPTIWALDIRALMSTHVRTSPKRVR